MSRWRLWIVTCFVPLSVGFAVPAHAGESDFAGLGEERLAARAASAETTDWRACRLDRESTGFLPVQSPSAAPCAPAPCCPQECCPRPCWGFRIGLMGWLPGIDGAVTLKGQEQEIDFPWTDWFDHLDKIDFALELWAQVRYEKWYFELGGLRMVLGDSVPLLPVPPVAIDAELTMVVLRGTVGYEFYRKSTSTRSPFPCLKGIVYAGVRYYSVDVEGTLRTPGAAVTVLDETQDWADPIVGVRGVYDLHRQWSLFADGDIGGFGVGSDFSWHLGGGVEWRPWKVFGIQLGWNHLDIDYSTGSGANLFKFDIALSGPFMNFIFSF